MQSNLSRNYSDDTQRMYGTKGAQMLYISKEARIRSSNPRHISNGPEKNLVLKLSSEQDYVPNVCALPPGSFVIFNAERDVYEIWRRV